MYSSEPFCPSDFPIYYSSNCYTDTTLFVTSAHIIINFTQCQPGKHYIEHFTGGPKSPHATCVTAKNLKKWDNYDPESKACAVNNYSNNNGKMISKLKNLNNKTMFG